MERDYRKHSSIVHSQLAAKHLFADILEKTISPGKYNI